MKYIIKMNSLDIIEGEKFSLSLPLICADIESAQKIVQILKRHNAFTLNLEKETFLEKLPFKNPDLAIEIIESQKNLNQEQLTLAISENIEQEEWFLSIDDTVNCLLVDFGGKTLNANDLNEKTMVKDLYYDNFKQNKDEYISAAIGFIELDDRIVCASCWSSFFIALESIEIVEISDGEAEIFAKNIEKYNCNANFEIDSSRKPLYLSVRV